jgi:sterol desaturase/sphingolipid hydroxylase (fatty acid hydroxylase superfamily)
VSAITAGVAMFADACSGRWGDAWTTRTLGTGNGHRRHHLDPPDLDWLTALWVVPAMLVLGWLADGVGLLAPALTAILCATLALGHYEWTHLLEHSSYRPRTRYYRRLARNHRLHHFRNERYWLGITSNLGDRLMSTLPDHPPEVPLSETARTLE